MGLEVGSIDAKRTSMWASCVARREQAFAFVDGTTRRTVDGIGMGGGRPGRAEVLSRRGRVVRHGPGRELTLIRGIGGQASDLVVWRQVLRLRRWGV